MKKIWLLFQILLFAVYTGSYAAGAESLFSIAFAIYILQSFPLNILFAWIFFAYVDPTAYPVILFLFAVAMSFVSYLQWFEAVPRIAAFFQKHFSKYDRDVHLVVEKTDKEEPKLLPDPVDAWAESFEAADNLSPVERLIKQDRR